MAWRTERDSSSFSSPARDRERTRRLERGSRRSPGIVATPCVIALLGFALGACGSDGGPATTPELKSSVPPPAPSTTSEPDDDDDLPPGSSADAGVENDAGGEEEEAGTITVTESWRGTLAASPRVKFGGAPYCDYYVTMRTIDAQLTLDSGGNVVDATVTANMFEEVGTSCTQPPIKQNKHTYTRSRATRGEDGAVTVTLVPKSTNEPRANLTITGNLSKTPASMKFQFHRYDLGSPFDWTVNATVSVARQ